MSDFRARISRKIGLPVGVFRLMSEAGVEMFDCHTLYDYGVGLGSTIRLDTWDGWNDFLNLTVMGFSSHVMASLMAEEVVAKYQMKVAMYMAAHFGHVDLAVSLQRCKWVTFTPSLCRLLVCSTVLRLIVSFSPHIFLCLSASMSLAVYVYLFPYPSFSLYLYPHLMYVFVALSPLSTHLVPPQWATL